MPLCPLIATGITSVTSGRCVPPANGSLSATTSPGAISTRVERGGDGHRHRAEMHRHVIALRDHAPIRVENCARIIASLLDVWREGGAAQRDAHLFRHRSKERAINLQRRWIEADFISVQQRLRMLPKLSIRAFESRVGSVLSLNTQSRCTAFSVLLRRSSSRRKPRVGFRPADKHDVAVRSCRSLSRSFFARSFSTRPNERRRALTISISLCLLSVTVTFAMRTMKARRNVAARSLSLRVRTTARDNASRANARAVVLHAENPRRATTLAASLSISRKHFRESRVLFRLVA